MGLVVLIRIRVRIRVTITAGGGHYSTERNGTELTLSSLERI